jgi:dihydroorotate dehydrogenase (fumarate)
MKNLETIYLGLTLKNPIIISSSGLTSSLDKIKKLEDNGAGAVVLKSLFEEQINYESASLSLSSDYPEANDLIDNYNKEHSIDEYLNLIRKAKESLSIPVMASINCTTSVNWIKFTEKIYEAGADALEINVYVLPLNKNAQAGEYENFYFDLAGKVRKTYDKPIAFKIGYQFTNLAALINRLAAAGINGVVLFNRFYEPDIDIDKLKITSSEIYSNPSDFKRTLRWVAILYDKVQKIDISASTGIHDGEAAIKALLAGARTVQVCSAIYKNGPKHIKNILHDITSWMENKQFNTIDDFRGKLSYRSLNDPTLYERTQFMKHFASII